MSARAYAMWGGALLVALGIVGLFAGIRVLALNSETIEDLLHVVPGGVLVWAGLRASWLEESIPLDPVRLEEVPHLTDLAGHIAESVVGAFFTGIPNLDVAHFPERAAEPELDFVLTIGEKRIPVEVKYRRRIDPHRDTLGLRSFLEKTHYNAPFAVLVTMLEGVEIPDPRIVPVSLRSLLLTR